MKNQETSKKKSWQEPYPDGASINPDSMLEALSLSHKELKTMTRKLSSSLGSESDTARNFYPKRFSVPSTHYDPFLYGTTEIIAIQSAALTGETFNNELIRKTHDELAYYNHPTFFVERDLLDMMRMTEVRESLSLEDVNWPINSMLLMFPKNYFPSALDLGGRKVYVMGLAVARTYDIQTLTEQRYARANLQSDTEGRHYNPEISHKFSRILDASDYDHLEYNKAMKEAEEVYGEPIRLIESISMIIPLSSGECCTCSYPITGANILDMLKVYENDYNVSESGEALYELLSSDVELSPSELKTEDTAMMQNMFKEGIKLIIYMASRKNEWSADGEKVERLSRTKRFRGRRVWSANWLGRKYRGYVKNACKGNESNGSKMAYHWRLGYQGIRWCGKGRTEKKVVTVMPYPVNPENKGK